MMKQAMNRSGLARGAAIMTCCGALIGCGDRGEDVSRVKEAARQLSAVGPGYEDADYTYAGVSQHLTGLELDDPEAEAARAGLLSQSRQGEAMAAGQEALLAERSLFDEISGARAALRRWEALRSEAAALTAYDPAEDLRLLRNEADQLAQRAEARRGDRDELASKIESMRSEIGSLREESSQKRTRAAELELEMGRLSAVEAAEQARRARDLNRQADRLDMQANRIEARVEMLEPRLEEIEQDISKLEQQRSLTLDAADKLRASVQDRQERAVEARAEAETRAEAADEAVTAIVEHRNQVVEPATESAIELFEQAVRAADRLSRESRTPGQLAKAGAARRLAEAQHVRAQGHGRFAALLEDLAGATPPLPRATEYASMGEAQRQAEATSRAEAADRYEEAARALRGAGVRGPEREGLETAAGELEALAAQLRGGGGTPPGEPGGAGNDAATEPATP